MSGELLEAASKEKECFISSSIYPRLQLSVAVLDLTNITLLTVHSVIRKTNFASTVIRKAIGVQYQRDLFFIRQEQDIGLAAAAENGLYFISHYRSKSTTF